MVNFHAKSQCSDFHFPTFDDFSCFQKLHFLNETWSIDGVIGDLMIDRAWWIDRYVTPYHFLGWWGDGFRDEFVGQLLEEARIQYFNNCLKDGIHAPVGDPVDFVYYPKGSKPLKIQEEFDCFISYRTK